MTNIYQIGGIMESAAGRISFYISLEDYEKIQAGDTIELTLSPDLQIQMRKKPRKVVEARSEWVFDKNGERVARSI